MDSSPPRFVRNNQLLKSFLDATTITTQISDEEEVIIDQTYNCVVCLLDLGDRAPTCKFCRGPACLDHLRKKRKLRNNFQTICDDCEDKLIFQALMKQEINIIDSLTIQQQILNLKQEELLQILDAKQTKNSLLLDKKAKLQDQRIKVVVVLQQRKKKLEWMQQRLNKQDIASKQLQKQLNQMQLSVPQAIYKDYLFMEGLNTKLNKSLLTLQNQIDETKKQMTKIQKDLSEAYLQWQNQKIVAEEQEQEQSKQKCIKF